MSSDQSNMDEGPKILEEESSQFFRFDEPMVIKFLEVGISNVNNEPTSCLRSVVCLL
jgi:hypothetical protein